MSEPSYAANPVQLQSVSAHWSAAAAGLEGLPEALASALLRLGQAAGPGLEQAGQTVARQGSHDARQLGEQAVALSRSVGLSAAGYAEVQAQTTARFRVSR